MRGICDEYLNIDRDEYNCGGKMDNCKKTRLVDCEAGRRMGCSTFCCRMLVRLQPDEMEPSDGTTPAKGFVDKDSEGYCIHFDRNNARCTNWEKRPKVCREYECNSDFLLQVVLRKGFKNIADLAKKAANIYIVKESYIKVPMLHTHFNKNNNTD